MLSKVCARSIAAGKNAMFQRVCMRIRAYLLAAFSVLAAPGCRSGAPPDSQGVAPELRLDGVRFRVYRDDGLRGDRKSVV